ncbi:cadherin domain-containing protein [Flagellimonas sp.]|uniref:cadherin domain-containing protein n=1 Tax=Flagellimonas sp. TaxID=2058762 RepID=UPI003F49E80C
MSCKKIFHCVLFLLIVMSCGKDDEPSLPPEPENNAPTMEAQTLSAAEDVAPGSKIGDISASDEDGDALSFALSGDSPFVLSSDGSLSLAENQNLDFEAATTYALSVTVKDTENATASATVTVNVTNVNEPPVFEKESFEFMPDEDILPNTPLGAVTATDPENDEIEFSISANDNDLFTIDPATGTISLAENKTLDFDTVPEHTITVTADDKKGETAVVNVGIGLINVNESPVFGQEAYNFEVSEGTPEDSFGSVSAEDPDGDSVIYEIIVNPYDLFVINPETGGLSLAEGQSLDFEAFEGAEPVYTLTVQASDSENMPQKEVTITVLDVNEAPVLTGPTSFNVNENIPDTEVFATLTAEDPEGTNVTLTLTDDAEGVFEMTGEGNISLVNGQLLDFEQQPNSYEIIVRTSDGTNESDHIIGIQVQNVNETPVVEDQQIDIEVVESINHVVNIAQIVASDPDGDETLSFDILGNNTLFEVDGNGIVSLIDGQNLDFEMMPNLGVTIQVSDGEFELQTQINLTITDSFADELTPYVTTWRTTNPNEEIRIPTTIGLDTYDFMIDWGDGTLEAISFIGNDIVPHVFENPGTYTVAIIGDFPRSEAASLNNAFSEKLMSIEQWGNIEWSSLVTGFQECVNMEYHATDTPNLINVQNIDNLFFEARSFNGDLSNWETENITSMNNVFRGADVFEGNGLSTWNTESVDSMNGMFRFASSFDQNLGNWNIQNITSMEVLFSASGMSPENYSQTLIGWAAQAPNIQNGVILDASGIEYCNTPEVLAARDILENTYGWIITDAGPVDCN